MDGQGSARDLPRTRITTQRSAAFIGLRPPRAAQWGTVRQERRQRVLQAVMKNKQQKPEI